jgi:hypothetical protein
MIGVAWRVASHRRERAYARRERGAGLLLVLRVESFDPADQIDTRRALRVLVQVREPYRSAMLERADGARFKEIAAEQNIALPTAANRVLVGRRRFRSAIRASQRPKRWRPRRR